MMESLRAHFVSKRSFHLSYRKGQLNQLLRLLIENESSLIEALMADFKSRSDAMLEHKLVTKEVTYILDNFEKWTGPTSVSAPLVNALDSCSIRYDPLGVVLIIGAWNYPLSLLLEPFAGAISAGNAVVLKPSEISAHTTALLTLLIAKYMDNDFCCIVNGGATETTALIEKEKFDHVFYTGSTAVGQIVYGKVACSSLTPVTLELGGKSPVIVDDNVDVDTTANRIVWAKLSNAGQTCIAPDYVLCSDRVATELTLALKASIVKFYGAEPKQSPDYSRVINQQHMDRLLKLYQENKDKVVVMMGEPDRETCSFPPTIFDKVAPSSSLMTQEASISIHWHDVHDACFLLSEIRLRHA